MEENNNNNTPEKSNGSNPMIVGGIIVILVLVIGVVAFAAMRPPESTDTAMEEEHTEDAMVEDEEHMMEEDTAMMEGAIEVEGGSFYFEPNEIRVEAGEEVTIQLNSVDMQHDFVIDELNIRTEIIAGGDSSSVTFTPTEPGEYEFYCSVGNHRAQGMVGTLIVE